jgi:Tol biopolymer transport system component
MRASVLILIFGFAIGSAFSQDSLRVIEASFNTDHDEYCAMDYDIGFAFCSNRRIEFHRQSIDSEYKSNTNILYIEGKIADISNFSDEINSVDNEGPFCFTKDQKRVYFTGTIVSKRAQVNNWLGIFYSDFENGTWSEPKPLSINSDDGTFDIAHPCVSPDGKLLIFTSNMQGGSGGNDLYAFEIRSDGYSIPYNLGPLVNSSGDEITPFLSSNNFLYFSSNLTEAGDFDIFQVAFDTEVLSERTRLLEPVNSEFHDLGFWLNTSNSEGTFSSMRNEHDFDVYLFTGFQRSKYVAKLLK